MIENPSAFPSGDFAHVEPGYGMTLRDWFAGHAPVSLYDAAIASGWSGLEAADMPKDAYRVTLWSVLTLMRYEYADAMLAERARSASA